MSEVVNQSLQKIAKGTGVVFIGTIIGMFLGFLGRVLIARFFTQAEYGIYSLALVILNIAVLLSTIGLQQGTPRQIAYYRGKTNVTRVQEVVSSSLQIALIASILLSIILFLASDTISLQIFHEPELVLLLKIFSIAIPFSVLTNVFASIFQGFDDVKPRVYFMNIRSGLFLLLLVLVILLGLPFQGVIYAFIASIIVACIIFAVYFLKKVSFSLKGINFATTPIRKELLVFSLPLLITMMLGQMLNWTDTLMLGYFRDSNIVGLYNGALPLARLILLILSSSGFIYLPIATGVYSKGSLEEMRRIYQVLTKWIFSVTIPLFFLFFLFPEVVLSFIFGANYVQASHALRILSFGFMFHVFLGINSYSLLVMGETRFLMLASSFTAIFNIILNAALIPTFGMTGAAFATTFSYLLGNILSSTKLYKLSKIHPFTRNYVKLLSVSIFLLSLTYVFTSHLKVEFWMLLFFLFIFLVGYGLLSLLTRSLDNEDITILLTLEKRMGISVTPLKRFLEKFI